MSKGVRPTHGFVNVRLEADTPVRRTAVMAMKSLFLFVKPRPDFLRLHRADLFRQMVPGFFRSSFRSEPAEEPGHFTV